VTRALDCANFLRVTSAPAYTPILSWRLKSVLAVVAVWTGLGCMSIANGLMNFRGPINNAEFVPARLIDWYTCAVFTPLYVWMARHWPLERATLGTRVPIWVLVTAAVVPLKYALQHGVMSVFVPTIELGSLSQTITRSFIPETIAFWAMIAVILSIEYYDRWRIREVQTNALGRQLAEARLEVLSAQLRPHFLFNTLQGISTLLHRDPAAADQMLTRLSELLRQSLRQADMPETTLAAELATLDNYLAIQHIRFQDRLRVHVDADGVRDAMLPGFILQPLVENAIEHGVARRSGPGSVSVAARVNDGQLEVEIGNDYSAIEDAPRASGGVGLKNTRERLAAMYGDRGRLATTRTADNRFLATISLPLKRS
jgi:two-component system LytT family sensor kinase